MERERQQDEPTSEPAEEASAPTVVVRGQTGAARVERRDALVMWSLAALGLITATLLDGEAAPVAWSLALAVGVASVLDRLLVGPAVRFTQRLGAESARLRAAMACPYCKDALPDDAAIACDRKGCGAFYHEECWAEVGAAYGGCAIYGCGSRSGHAVGRFALRRHVLRLLLAAALFPPRLVKRIQETERQSFRDVWRQARGFQERISQDPLKTALAGLGYAAISALAALALTRALDQATLRPGPLPVAILLGMLALLLLPVLLMRLPLAGHFGWGLWRLVGRIFRDELAALGRADQGTFLARLAGGAGKKDA